MDTCTEGDGALTESPEEGCSSHGVERLGGSGSKGNGGSDTIESVQALNLDPGE